MLKEYKNRKKKEELSNLSNDYRIIENPRTNIHRNEDSSYTDNSFNTCERVDTVERALSSDSYKINAYDSLYRDVNSSNTGNEGFYESNDFVRFDKEEKDEKLQLNNKFSNNVKKYNSEPNQKIKKERIVSLIKNNNLNEDCDNILNKHNTKIDQKFDEYKSHKKDKTYSNLFRTTRISKLSNTTKVEPVEIDQFKTNKIEIEVVDTETNIFFI